MNESHPIVKVGRARKYQLQGIRFGLLTAKKETRDDQGNVRWSCVCDCNKRVTIRTPMLINGHAKSCGCSGNDLRGKTFGRLTVTALSKTRNESGNRLWVCSCECGNTVRVRTASLKNGNTKSCGCLKINNLRGVNNYQAQRTLKRCGVWIPSDDPWAVRATRILSYARRNNVKVAFKTVGEFALYLKSIAPKVCPVFGKRLVTGKGQSHKWSPSVDKIIPSKGYVPGNIQIISLFANTMKQDATPNELKAFARWVLETFK